MISSSEILPLESMATAMLISSPYIEGRYIGFQRNRLFGGMMRKSLLAAETIMSLSMAFQFSLGWSRSPTMVSRWAGNLPRIRAEVAAEATLSRHCCSRSSSALSSLWLVVPPLLSPLPSLPLPSSPSLPSLPSPLPFLPLPQSAHSSWLSMGVNSI
ncbi:hypothetical protein ES703_105548 [subsurface metagenome]